ncbi:MAG: guanylate kinase [Chloroflexi bacterium]|nr:guanylate kinase [Chloroflexota bacterium]
MENQEPSLHPPPPLLLVLSGPSGVGKDAVLRQMKDLKLPYHFTVTATTRPRRPSECEGVDYHFLAQETFDRMVAAGEFLEWARVYGNCYGVPRAQVRRALEAGQDVIIKADVQGAATIKKLAPQGVFIFLAPPSLAELERRLWQRKTENREEMEVRLRTARAEMERLPMFDYLVVNYNSRLDETVATIEAIIRAEKCRIAPRQVRL